VSVYFWIVPVVLGQIPIQVKAESNGAADAVVHQLLVKVLNNFSQYLHFALLLGVNLVA